MTQIDNTLDERGNNYGEYHMQAELSQKIKTVFMGAESYHLLKDYQHEALDMIANKLARILNGNPMYDDSWHDISGYATLVVKELRKIETIEDCGPGVGYVNQD